MIGDNREHLGSLYERVELGATYTCTDCMPHENNKPIWIARDSYTSLEEVWPQLKFFF